MHEHPSHYRSEAREKTLAILMGEDREGEKLRSASRHIEGQALCG
jgi:hypothetical protein